MRAEYYGRYEDKGVVFHIWRKWGDGAPDHLECYVDGHLFATTKRYIDFRDFVLWCFYNYPHKRTAEVAAWA